MSIVSFRAPLCHVCNELTNQSRKVAMMKTQSLLAVFCLVILIPACVPSAPSSDANTEAAKPTATKLSSDISARTATTTSSPPQNVDVRVIDIDPKKLLLEKTELPLQGKYIIPGPGWISPSTNSEAVAFLTVE